MNDITLYNCNCNVFTIRLILWLSHAHKYVIRGCKAILTFYLKQCQKEFVKTPLPPSSFAGPKICNVDRPIK